jgi:hypothetical protein
MRQGMTTWITLKYGRRNFLALYMHSYWLLTGTEKEK